MTSKSRTDYFTRKSFFVFLLITLLCLIHITYLFSQREGQHSDESWSYGFANAHYVHQLYEDEAENITNYNEWRGSQLFRNYIEVQNGQRFDLNSVRYNMSNDFSPPLHSMLLHMICSLAPDTFSWWYAYLINAFALIATMLGLYLLSFELSHSRPLSLSICFFYGSLSAVENCFLFLRGYALLTALAVFFTWLHCRMFRKRFQHVRGELIGLFFVGLVGHLTHYYFYAFALCFTFFFALYLLLGKRIRILLFYCLTMALSVLASFGLNPYAVGQLLAGDSIYTRHMKLKWEIQQCIRFVVNQGSGMDIRFPTPVTWATLHVILIYLAIFAGAFSFIFRREEWFHRLCRRLLAWFKQIPHRLRHIGKLPFLLCLALLHTLLIIAKISNILLMGAFADRYLFFLMPVFSALTVYFLYKMVRKFGRRLSSPCQVTIIALFLLAGIVQNQIIYPGHYLFLRDTETGEQTIESITKDADVIFVTPFDWHMVFYSTKLYDSHQFFAVLTESALDVTEQINDCPDFDPERPLYLIVEREKLRSEKFHRDKSLPDHILTFEESLTYDFSMTDVVNEISSSTVADKKEFLHSEKYFGGTLEIYRLR